MLRHDHFPGSTTRIEEYQRRAALGLPIFNDEDHVPAEDDEKDERRLKSKPKMPKQPGIRQFISNLDGQWSEVTEVEND